MSLSPDSHPRPHHPRAEGPAPAAAAGPTGAAALAWLLLAAGGCSPQASAASRQAPTQAAPAGPSSAAVAIAVRLAPVERGPVDRPVRAGGLLRQKNEVDLAFKVGGIISAITVEEGARVRRGQLLARLDTTELAAGVAQAREAAERADRDLLRTRRLRESGAVALAEEQNAATGAAVARAVLEAQRWNAGRAELFSPDDGWIDRRLAAVGEVAAPGRPILHLSGRSRGAVVRLGLSDGDALGLAVGARALVVLDARPDRPLPAQVSQIATTASPGIGTYEVEVRLLEPPPQMLSGMTAKVTIDHRESPAGHVPLASLVEASGRSAVVYAVREGRAVRLPVTVAFLFADRAALSAGIDGVEQVVVEGAAALHDGAAVRLVP